MVRNGALLFTFLLFLCSSALAEEQATAIRAVDSSIEQNEFKTTGMIVTKDCDDASTNVEISNVPPEGILVTGCEELPAPGADPAAPSIHEADNKAELEE